MPAPAGASLLGAVGSVGASPHVAVYVVCVFACSISLLRTVVARLAMCYRGDVCLGVLRDARSRSNRLHCDPVL